METLIAYFCIAFVGGVMSAMIVDLTFGEDIRRFKTKLSQWEVW